MFNERCFQRNGCKGKFCSNDMCAVLKKVNKKNNKKMIRSFIKCIAALKIDKNH